VLVKGRCQLGCFAMRYSQIKFTNKKKTKMILKIASKRNEKFCKSYFCFFFELWGRCFSIVPWQLVDLRTALQADISSFVCWRWMKFAATLKLWNNNDISIFVNFCLSSSTYDAWRLFVANPTTQLANQELHLQGEKTAGSFPSGTLSISCARIGPHVWPPPNPGVASR